MFTATHHPLKWETSLPGTSCRAQCWRCWSFIVRPPDFAENVYELTSKPLRAKRSCRQDSYSLGGCSLLRARADPLLPPGHRLDCLALRLAPWKALQDLKYSPNPE